MRVALLYARGTGRMALDEVRQHPERDREQQAAAVGLSEPMIGWARTILKRGAPELIQAVEEGRIALYAAAKVAKYDHAGQRRFLRLDARGRADGTLARDEDGDVVPFLTRRETQL